MMQFDGISGVYCAIHRDSGMCYVGSSINVGYRIRQHISLAMNGSQNHFHRALAGLGVDAFDFELLCPCVASELRTREHLFIVLYGCASLRGFNTVRNPMRPYPSENMVTRQRISASRKGMVFSASHRAAISAALTGKKQPADLVEKRANACFKRVIQCRRDGSSIAEFHGIKTAAMTVGINPRRITEVIKGRIPTAGGYKWRLK